MIARSTWAVLFIGLFGCFTQTGCMITQPMWKAADQTYVNAPAFSGVLLGTNGKPESAVIHYEVKTEHDATPRQDLYAILPLNLQGVPPAPFAYAGNARTDQAILGEMPESQRAAILAANAPYNWKVDAEAQPILSSPRFRAASATPHGQGGCQVRVRQMTVNGSKEPEAQGYVFFAYAYEQQAAFNPDEFDKGEVNSGSPLPQNAIVLVMPRNAPRPQRAIDAAKSNARAMTFLTVPADGLLGAVSIVLLPFNLIMYMTVGHL